MIRVSTSRLAVVALVAAGCGGSGASRPPRPASPTTTARVLPHVPAALPTPGPTHKPASPRAVAVIRGWSTALRAGRVAAAAGYFQLPSELINGGGSGGTLALIRIDTRQQAEAANETLPCGATFISADQRGQYVNALFRLTGRSGPGAGSCGSGTGQTARTNFLISDGHIVEWIRAPDDPGDNGPPGGGGNGGGGNGGGGNGGGGNGGGGGGTAPGANTPVV
jgi:hypothetical protein